MTETRAEKAQRLVDEGRVNIWGRTEYGIRAFVTSGSREYLTVLYPNGRYWCECDWGKYRSSPTDLCAHALAVKLAVERRQEP